MNSINSIIEYAVQENASDVYLMSGHPPKIRITKSIKTLSNFSPIVAKELNNELKFWLSEAQQELLKKGKNISFVIDSDLGPLRLQVFSSNGSIALHIRPLPPSPQNLNALKLPQSLGEIVQSRKGLILVSGQAGSGRSSLIRGMLLERQNGVVFTCEHPIEILLPSRNSMVIQTELHKDGESMAELIDNAVRMNADVIFCSAMENDSTTAEMIMKAAVSTLIIVECYGNDEVDSLRRFQLLIPNGQTDIRRRMLAENICALISTQLVPQSNGERAPVVGITHFNQSCVDRVKLDNMEGLRTLVSRGNAQPTSQYVDHILAEMVKGQQLRLEDALRYAVEPSSMKLRASGIIHKD